MLKAFFILFRVSVICNLFSLTKSSSSLWLYQEIPHINKRIVHEYFRLHPLFSFLLSPPKGGRPFNPSFSSFAFSACITDAFNYTLGHSDAIYGLGLQPPRFKQHLSTEEQNTVEQKKKKSESSDEIKGGLVDNEEGGQGEEDEEENQIDGVSAISFEELNGALSNALRISSLNVDQVCALDGEDGGWKLIHRVGDSFCLYKRRLQLSEDLEEKAELVPPSSSTAASSPLSLLSSRLPLRNLLVRGRRRRSSDSRKLSPLSTAGDSAASNTSTATPEGSRLGPIQYLMTGNCADVSPLTFLHAQIDKQCRERWDRTMKEISAGQLQLSDYRNESTVDSATTDSKTKTFFQQAQDVLYYRTKWPWPLKDRDYTLARRCKVFPAHNAVVFISKSVESADYPPREGVVRVDNYWCHSAIISHGNYSNTPATALETEEDASDSGGSIQYTTTTATGWGLGMGSREGRSTSRSDRRIGVEVEFSFGNRRKDGISRPRFVRDPDSEPESRFEDEKSSSSPEDDTVRIPGEGREDEDAQVRSKHNGKRGRVDTIVGRPGMKFVTFFCDDQKVPLHPSIVDLLSSYGEKMVPGSMERLFVVAKDVESRRQLKLQPAPSASSLPDTEQQQQQQPPLA